MPSVGELKEVSGFLAVIKDLPAWILTAVSIAFCVLLFVPVIGAAMPGSFHPWIMIGAVLFTALAVFKWISVGVQWWRARKAVLDARKTVYLTPQEQQCLWSVTRQSDDSYITHLVADFLIKNRTDSNVGLVLPRLVKPYIAGEIVNSSILVRSPDENLYGTAYVSGHIIPPRGALPARVMIAIRGRPSHPEASALTATISLSDDEGNEHWVKVRFRGRSPLQAVTAPAFTESILTIQDPIEKAVVSVLQSEANRYDKCGRSVGGLGSIHVVYQGAAMTGVGGDSWIANSPTNQSIALDPENSVVRSDNIDAMLALYSSLANDSDKQRFIEALISRIGTDKGYQRVAYFIVYALWNLGHLNAALLRGKTALPEGDIKTFGLSNVLMLLNGLLRYRHPKFSSDQLERIETFIDGMQEHSFKIAEKIAAIRTARILVPTTTSAPQADQNAEEA